MIDFGFDKLLLIGGVALIVIGPERLPKVARTVGHFVGKAQRYVADVKAEVNRSIELDELKAMKTKFEDAARDVQSAVHHEIHQTSTDLNTAWRGDGNMLGHGPQDAVMTSSGDHTGARPSGVDYRAPKKNWRLKRSALPHWYRQRHGVRAHAQSGAARVARFRPPAPGR